MMQTMFRTFLAFILLVSVFCTNGYAQVAPNHDVSQPVEITADNLEVLQEKSLAIFSGNVEAIQGQMNIRSDKMKVYYRDSSNKADNQSSVSKIETLGRVFLSSATETAQGNNGIYDVDKNMVTLNGDVVLTSGKNIVKGSQLVYNVTTGKSKMSSDGVDSASKKQRVRGVFIPDGAGG